MIIYELKYSSLNHKIYYTYICIYACTYHTLSFSMQLLYNYTVFAYIYSIQIHICSHIHPIGESKKIPQIGYNNIVNDEYVCVKQTIIQSKG